MRNLTTALILTAAPALAQPVAVLPAPEYLGQIVLPSGLAIEGVGFGGISDLAYDAGSGRWLAISDDRAEHGPARYYELEITPGERGIALNIAAMHELRDETGAGFAPKTTDPEAIVLDADGRIFWSSERDQNGQPAIYMVQDGETRRLSLPEAYTVGPDHGPRDNLAFEALTISGNHLIAGMENALVQDGPIATLEAGSLSRLLVIDKDSLTPVAEYAYLTEAIHQPGTGEQVWNDNGLTALEQLPDGPLVAVERSFASGVGNHIRFFTLDLTGATNILGQDKASGQPVAKTPWFQIGEGDFGLDIDNIESLAFSPVIDGRQIFVIASDDNFNPRGQFTQFVVFAIAADAPTAPESVPHRPAP